MRLGEILCTSTSMLKKRRTALNKSLREARAAVGANIQTMSMESEIANINGELQRRKENGTLERKRPYQRRTLA